MTCFTYYTSYNKNSKYYTIAPIPEFDEDGLWRYGGIYFSRHGTLKNTIIYLIEKSHSGLTAGELSRKLGVKCYSILSQFAKKGVIDRVKSDEIWLYVSKSPEKRDQQLAQLPPVVPLNPQTAMLVLVEYVKNPDASFKDISTSLHKRHIMASRQAINKLFEDHQISKISEIISLIYVYRQQIQTYNNPLNFFEEIPTIDFMPEEEFCPKCGKELKTYKTAKRKIHTIGMGTFIAREIQLKCREHAELGAFRCQDLTRIVPPGSNFAYDVMVEAGQLRFLKYRQIKEIQAIFQEKYGIFISESEIELLVYKFILYLSAVHQDSADLIKAYIENRGGYILHIDSTCKDDSPKLASSIDELSGFVLHSVKLRTENQAEMTQFLMQIQASYGSPLAVISDMGKGIVAAVQTVFGDVAHYICHFHFVKAVGKSLFGTEDHQIYSQLKKVGIKSKLNKLRRGLEKEIDGLSVEKIEEYLQNPQILQDNEQGTEILSYCLILWLLDYSSEGDGYGFPFDQSYLRFYERLRKADDFIDEVLKFYLPLNDNHKIWCKLRNLIQKITKDDRLSVIANAYGIKLDVFENLREALGAAPTGKSEGLANTGITESESELENIRTAVTDFCKNLKEQIKTTKNEDISKSFDKLQQKLEKYWDKLFSDPIEIEIDGNPRTIFIHRTNNLIEQHFRRLNYGWRRVHGNSSVKKDLISIPEALPLVMNLKNKAYLKLIFDDEFRIAQKFSEIDVGIIRKKLAEKKVIKISCSQKIKKNDPKL
jgi:hypothetical protein